MVFRTGAAAAGLLGSRAAEGFRRIHAHGVLVAHAVVRRMDRTHELVVKHALVIVHVPGVVRVVAVQVLGEFREVIGTAGLVDVRVREQVPLPVGHHAGIHAHHLGVGLTKHLAVAHAAHGIGVPALDHLPEVPGNVVVTGFAAHLVRIHGTHDHRDMLVRVTGADIVDILRKRLIERRGIEALRRFQQVRLLHRVRRLGRQAGQGFLHAAHLAGDVHVPHLIAVARPCLALRLVAVHLHIGPVMQAVPHPEAHVLRDQQRLRGDLRIVDVLGNVNEPGQLLVDGVIRGPHTLLIIIRSVFLDEDRMLRRNGVDIAVSVAPGILLVLIEGRPRSFQLVEFRFGNQVPRLAIAAQCIVPDKGKFLTGTQFINYPLDPFLQGRPGGRIVGTGERERQGGHVVARPVSLELRGRGIPAVGDGIALRRKAVGVTIVVQLLGDVQRKKVPDVQVAVSGKPVVADEPDAPERQRPRHGRLRGNRGLLRHHRHLRIQRISVLGRIVAEDIPPDRIGGPGRHRGLLLLGLPEGIGPLNLPPGPGPVGIGHPHLIRQERGGPDGRLHPDGGDFTDRPGRFLSAAGGNEDGRKGQQKQDAQKMTGFHGHWDFSASQRYTLIGPHRTKIVRTIGRIIQNYFGRRDCGRGRMKKSAATTVSSSSLPK